MKCVSLYCVTFMMLGLTACSSDTLVGEETPLSEQLLEHHVPVEFGTYMGRQANTREDVAGGATGAIDQTSDLVGSNKGFGVIAYYTGASNYSNWNPVSPATKAPNFMYNEHIVGTTSGATTTWDYAEPGNKKYWPNDISTSNGGSVDTQSSTATGTGIGGKVSFFAYAPYVSVDVSNTTASERGKVNSATVGILALSSNQAVKNPTVTYKLDISGSKMVDLLWGTTGTNGTNVLGNTNNGATLSGGKAAVNVDLTKQKTLGKVEFAFKHALARLGGISNTKAGLQVQLDIDKEDGDIKGGSKNDNTKVTIKSITIKTPATGGTPDNSIDVKGILDLALGTWTAASPEEKVQVTHSIGTNNATEDNGLNQIKLTLAEPLSISQWSDIPDGVTTTAQNVYKAEYSPFYIIPIANSNPELTFTIDYIVRTKDENLDKGYSEVEQIISKTIQLDCNGTTEGLGEYEANKRYNIVIHLGLTSVKFTASVSSWDDATSNETNNGEVYLPINVKD